MVEENVGFNGCSDVSYGIYAYIQVIQIIFAAGQQTDRQTIRPTDGLMKVFPEVHADLNVSTFTIAS